MRTNLHLLWLWTWYLVGTFLYMLQRSYYGVTSDRPVATTYRGYFIRCFVPLLSRFIIEAVIYWATFTPELLQAGLRALGWEEFASMVETLSKFAPFAFFFGLFMDFFVDFSVTKIPIIKDVWPQMPGPMKPAPSQQEEKSLRAAAEDCDDGGVAASSLIAGADHSTDAHSGGDIGHH